MLSILPLRSLFGIVLFCLFAVKVYGASDVPVALAGTDGGGGTDVISSSPKEFISAAARAKRFLDDYDIFRLVGNNFKTSDENDLQALTILRAIGNYKGNQPGWETAAKVFAQTKMYLRARCVAGDRNEHDASVTKNAFGAEICLSQKLLRFPPGQFLINVLIAVIAHEYTHIFGYGEREGRLVQNFFMRNLDSILGRDHGHLRKQLLALNEILIQRTATYQKQYYGDQLSKEEMINRVNEVNVLLQSIKVMLPPPQVLNFDSPNDDERYQKVLEAIQTMESAVKFYPEYIKERWKPFRSREEELKRTVRASYFFSGPKVLQLWLNIYLEGDEINLVPMIRHE